MSVKVVSVEENIAVARRWNEVGINEHRLDLIDELFHPNYSLRGGTAAGAWSITMQGLETIKSLWESALQDYPTAKVVIDDIFGVDDKVVMRWTMLNEGKLARIGITIYRMLDGLILDDWACLTMA